MEDVLTIAIPVFNRATYFKEALESALNQVVPTKVLVVDNASTAFDFERAVNQYGSPRLSYHRNPTNLGMVGNWNRCIEFCATPYLLILHDDDKLDTSYSKVLQPLIPSELNLIVCRFEVIDQSGRVIGRPTAEEFASFAKLEFWRDSNPAAVGAVFRVDEARRLGGFRPSLKFSPDYDFWFRLALAERFHVVNEVMGWYREHPDPERVTTVLRKGFENTGLLHVQIRRNVAAFARAFPERPQPPLHYRHTLYFRDLVESFPSLSSRRARYAMALFTRTPASTLGGKLLRMLARYAGIPLSGLARALVRIGGRT